MQIFVLRSVINEMKKLHNEGLSYVFIANAFSSLMSLLWAPIIVRILSKQDYGVFVYAWNIYSIIILFNGMGMESGVLQIVSENDAKKNNPFSVLKIGLKYGLVFDVFLVTVILIVGFCVRLPIEGSNRILLLMACMPVIQFIYSLIVTYLRAQKSFREYSRALIVYSFFNVSFACLGALVLNEKGIVLGMYCAYAIASVFVLWHFKGLSYVSKSKEQICDKKELIRISVFSMFSNGCSGLMYLLDVFLLGIIVGDESILAGYKNATIIPSAMVIIPNAIIAFVYPSFAEKKDDRLWIKKKGLALALRVGLTNLIVSSMLFIAAPWFIPLFFGKEYSDVVYLFRVLLLNFFISGTFRIVFGNLLAAQRRVYFNLFVTILSGTINIIADCLLIKGYGGPGAAWATVISDCVISVLVVFYWVHTVKNKGGSTE